MKTETKITIATIGIAIAGIGAYAIVKVLAKPTEYECPEGYYYCPDIEKCVLEGYPCPPDEEEEEEEEENGVPPEEGHWTGQYACEGTTYKGEWKNPDGTKIWKIIETDSEYCKVHVYGKVRDVNQYGISDVLVKLVGRNNKQEFGAITDSNGDFDLGKIPKDFYDITVSKEGYNTKYIANYDLTYVGEKNLTYSIGALYMRKPYKITLSYSPVSPTIWSRWCCGIHYLPDHGAIYVTAKVVDTNNNPFKNVFVSIETKEPDLGGFDCKQPDYPKNCFYKVSGYTDKNGIIKARYFAGKLYKGNADRLIYAKAIYFIGADGKYYDLFDMQNREALMKIHIGNQLLLDTATCYGTCERAFYLNGSCLLYDYNPQ
jgi:hypothetical protein